MAQSCRPPQSLAGDGRSARADRPQPAPSRPDANGFVRVGHIAGSHGLRGALRVRVDDSDATSLADLARLFVETTAGPREFEVRSVTALSSGHLRVVLEGIDDISAAQSLRGCPVMAAIADLPPLGDRQFYYFQLVGAEVITTDGRRLGTIEEIFPTGANDVWVVREGAREVLIPVIADVVKAMDLSARRITIEPLPGLLD
jgi:16S rRNA processing protein RimM